MAKTKTVKLDWWIITGYYMMFLALYDFFGTIIEGKAGYAMLSLVVDMLFAVGFLKRSHAAFWIFVVVQVLVLLAVLSVDIPTKALGVSGFDMIFGLMLLVLQVFVFIQMQRENLASAVQRELKKQKRTR